MKIGEYRALKEKLNKKTKKDLIELIIKMENKYYERRNQSLLNLRKYCVNEAMKAKNKKEGYYISPNMLTVIVMAELMKKEEDK